MLRTLFSSTVLIAPLLAQGELAELHANVPKSYSLFGTAVDMHADWLLVGAPLERKGHQQVGAAHLFDLTSGAHVDRFRAPDGQAFDHFGGAVAVSDELVVIGAPRHDALGSRSGAVYVFERATGDLLAKLLAPGAASDWEFGESVGVNDDYLVANAPGVGHIFVYDATTLALLRTILPPPEYSFNPGHGLALALDGNRISVGCTIHPIVWVYDVSTGDRVAEVQKTPDGAGGGYFGRASALRDDDLLVGAPVDWFLAPQQGAAWAFDVVGEAERWGSRPAGLGLGARYATSVALTDRFAVVGAPQHHRKPIFVEGEAGEGGVWVLDRETGFVITRVLSGDGQPADNYGFSVAADEALLAVGAFGDDSVGEAAGAVYLHTLPQLLGAIECTPAVPNSTGVPARIEALGSSAVSDQALVLIARDLQQHQLGLFLVSATPDHVPMIGGSQGTLCLGGSIARFQGQAGSSGELGALRCEVDLEALPGPIGQPVLPGETWRFQAWYRDQNPGATSNFTDVVAVAFL